MDKKSQFSKANFGYFFGGNVEIKIFSLALKLSWMMRVCPQCFHTWYVYTRIVCASIKDMPHVVMLTGRRQTCLLLYSHCDHYCSCTHSVPHTCGEGWGERERSLTTTHTVIDCVLLPCTAKFTGLTSYRSAWMARYMQTSYRLSRCVQTA